MKVVTADKFGPFLMNSCRISAVFPTTILELERLKLEI